MWQNFIIVLKVAIELGLQFAALTAIAVTLTKFYERNEERIKKYEPAVRERVHKVAKAINW